jgi:hypothetical protein
MCVSTKQQMTKLVPLYGLGLEVILSVTDFSVPMQQDGKYVKCVCQVSRLQFQF